MGKLSASMCCMWLNMGAKLLAREATALLLPSWEMNRGNFCLAGSSKRRGHMPVKE